MAQVGQVLGERYRLVELLGQGGMATIYRGHDLQLGRDVAVKVLRSEYGRDAAFVARFRQEAQSAAALSHPNVVNVFDYGMENGDPFIVMELLDGGDLADVLSERGALEPLAAARIAQQVFDALDAAHGQGIVHRDIKPTNVLLTRAGRVKVADFGIARAFSEAQLTMPGTTLGSVHYFSPEQARGELVTTASDVYSAGLVLFEMLTGRRAWTGDSAGAVAVARLAGDPAAPSSIRPGVSPALDVIVRRALSRVPSDRPTAGELSVALGRFIADPARATAAAAGAVPVAAPPAYAPSAEYGTARRTRRPAPDEDEEEEERGGPWGWIAATLAVLVLLAGGVLLFVILSGRPAASPTPAPVAVEVPNFVGQQLDAAQQQASELGLVLGIGEIRVSADAPENQIIEQDPPAGTEARSGQHVSVVVATRKVTVEVPDLRRRTEAELVAILLQNTLEAGSRSDRYSDDVEATLVIETNPRAGVEVATGSVVDYVLSLGPAPTPTPTPEPTATPAPTPEATPTPSPPPTPEPTPTPSPPPTPEPTPTPMPTPTPVSVRNYSAGCTLTLEQASELIAADDLQLGVVWPPGYDPATWRVQIQDPPPGTEVPPGSRVHLFVISPDQPCS
ncbi:MAG TPA: Stk1 family PASTA domain-containing Ser/Thr kinase, partial [Candidatus Limnocylindria bacterium]|nr:Stk1 family PASTA domain-containing Ser/Thr kinase [Candidatus Limnocylindria bacterium]